MAIICDLFEDEEVTLSKVVGDLQRSDKKGTLNHLVVVEKDGPIPLYPSKGHRRVTLRLFYVTPPRNRCYQDHFIFSMRWQSKHSLATGTLGRDFASHLIAS